MVITATHVTKRIKKRVVLDDVSVSARSGEVVGLVGENGSGKTMLLRVLSGLVHADAGEVRIDGALLGEDIDFPPSIGLLIEGPAFIEEYSGYENLRMLAMVKHAIGPETVRGAIVQMGLDPDDRRPVRAYSLGMRQRLGIAMAIMERPDLVLLDEPSNALDEDGVRTLRDVIRGERARGAAVVLASHDKGLVRDVADRVLRMSSGRVLSQAPGCDDGDE